MVSFVSKSETFAILFSTFVLKLVLVTKSVILGILFSITITFELNVALVSKPVISGILYPISVIFVL